MRKFVLFLSVTALLALAGRASAQQFSGSVGASMSGPSGSSGPNASSFFSQSMLGSRPQHPTPLNFTIGSMLPTFSHLQDMMLMRNTFSGPQVIVATPSQGTPRPRMKKTN